LREKLLDDIPSDESGDILDTWKDWGSDMLTMGTVTNEVKEDLILKMILDNNSANLSASTNINMSNNFDADQGIGRDVLDKALGIANIVTTANEFLQANSIRAMFKIAGPMILAMMQMIVIIAAPFIMPAWSIPDRLVYWLGHDVFQSGIYQCYLGGGLLV